MNTKNNDDGCSELSPLTLGMCPNKKLNGNGESGQLINSNDSTIEPTSIDDDDTRNDGTNLTLCMTSNTNTKCAPLFSSLINPISNPVKGPFTRLQMCNLNINWFKEFPNHSDHNRNHFISITTDYIAYLVPKLGLPSFPRFSIESPHSTNNNRSSLHSNRFRINLFMLCFGVACSLLYLCFSNVNKEEKTIKPFTMYRLLP